MGRVLSVDQEEGALSVALIDGEERPNDTEEGEKTINVTIPPDRLPKNLRVGRVIRKWGELTQETGCLEATHLHAQGHGIDGKDPTGVRRRIGKNRGRIGGRGGGRGRGK